MEGRFLERGGHSTEGQGGQLGATLSALAGMVHTCPLLPYSTTDVVLLQRWPTTPGSICTNLLRQCNLHTRQADRPNYRSLLDEVLGVRSHLDCLSLVDVMKQATSLPLIIQRMIVTGTSARAEPYAEKSHILLADCNKLGNAEVIHDNLENLPTLVV